jgi:hypothetical protein
MSGRYRTIRQPPDFLLVEDEVGLRYGIAKGIRRVLRYAPSFAPWRHTDQPQHWENLRAVDGADAAELIEAIMGSIAPE